MISKNNTWSHVWIMFLMAGIFFLFKASGWGGKLVREVGLQLRAYRLALQLRYHSSCGISHDRDLIFASCWDDSFACMF